MTTKHEELRKQDEPPMADFLEGIMLLLTRAYGWHTSEPPDLRTTAWGLQTKHLAGGIRSLRARIDHLRKHEGETK